MTEKVSSAFGSSGIENTVPFRESKSDKGLIELMLLMKENAGLHLAIFYFFVERTTTKVFFRNSHQSNISVEKTHSVPFIIFNNVPVCLNNYYNNKVLYIRKSAISLC